MSRVHYCIRPTSLWRAQQKNYHALHEVAKRQVTSWSRPSTQKACLLSKVRDCLSSKGMVMMTTNTCILHLHPFSDQQIVPDALIKKPLDDLQRAVEIPSRFVGDLRDRELAADLAVKPLDVRVEHLNVELGWSHRSIRYVEAPFQDLT